MEEAKMDGLTFSIIYLLIIGGVAGYFMGYLIKKLSHLALTIGIFGFLLMFMVYIGAMNLDLNELIATITRFASVLGPLGFATLASSKPFVGRIVVGLVLGLKRVY
jgi:uncharacterized membrane protein (Fun14 family)